MNLDIAIVGSSLLGGVIVGGLVYLTWTTLENAMAGRQANAAAIAESPDEDPVGADIGRPAK